jgi:hypothetical protein
VRTGSRAGLACQALVFVANEGNQPHGDIVSEPTPQELREADIAREAQAKGYTLMKHTYYSLQSDGQTAMGPVDGLEAVAHFMEYKPRQPGR